MAAKALPSQEVLRQLLDYDPATGVLTWRTRALCWFQDGKQTRVHNAAIWNGKNAGKQAFITMLPSGHRYAGVFGQKLLAHRVIWKMVTGDEPDTVDHVNGDASDNRWQNLRNVSQRVNSCNCKLSKNNTSGVNGVSWDERRQNWCVSVNVNYRKLHVGAFDTLEAATAARKQAEREHGFHENHGRAA
jgi:hypothetical protein